MKYQAKFSLTKMYLKMLSPTWRPLCFGLNVLIVSTWIWLSLFLHLSYNCPNNGHQAMWHAGVQDKMPSYKHRHFHYKLTTVVNPDTRNAGFISDRVPDWGSSIMYPISCLKKWFMIPWDDPAKEFARNNSESARDDWICSNRLTL